MAPTFFLPSSQQISQNPEGRDLMDTSHSGLNAPSSLTVYCLPVVLCICFHLLQEEASLLVAEQGTDLWVYQNAIRSHFITVKNSIFKIFVCLWWVSLCMLTCDWVHKKCHSIPVQVSTKHLVSISTVYFILEGVSLLFFARNTSCCTSFQEIFCLLIPSCCKSLGLQMHAPRPSVMRVLDI